jgi:DNA-binding MarR family transcriptional regulator
MPGTTRTIREDLKQNRPFRTSSHEAYVALLRTADDAKRHMGQLLEASGVTLQQYNVLRILRGAAEEGLPTLSVAERMIERTPGVTRLIDRMERKGWVTRQRCTRDRRRVWCRVTDTGLSLLESLEQPVEETNNVLAEALEEGEIVSLIDYLDRVRAIMKDANG